MEGKGGGSRENSPISCTARAALLLVDDDPTADIADTLSIRAVWCIAACSSDTESA